MLLNFFLILLVLLSFAGQALSASAITSDGSMGTTVTQGGTVFDITGGTRSGSNLFHSFGLFSVGTGDTANFLNDSGLNTSNIIGRVTGGQTSSIFGTIKTTNFGSASLFLINPAGWVFGPTASLNVGGSFHVSTADYLKFAGGAKFHADLAKQSMLTTASVSAFGFLSQNPAGTTIQGSFLGVPPGQTLSMASGAINIVGTLFAPGGKIQLASVASSCEVPLNVQDMNLSDFAKLASINLNSASLSSSGNGGGTVIIRGGQLLISGSNISANNLGNSDSTGMGIDISGENVTLTNGSFIQSSTFALGHGGSVQVEASDTITLNGTFPTGIFADAQAGSGDAGDIIVKAKNVTLSNGAEIRSDTFTSGNGGTVQVTASETVSLSGPFPTGIFAGTNGGTGDAGNILVNANKVTMTDGALIRSSTFGVGAGGAIGVTSNNLELAAGAQINADTFGKGNAGNITIRAADSVTLVDATNNGFNASGILALARRDSSGKAGNILIEAKNVTIQGGAQVNSTTFGSGDGGTITIKASDAVTLSGHGSHAEILGGGIFAEADFRSIGNAGDIILIAGKVSIGNEAEIDSSTEGPGRGGSIKITAKDSVVLFDDSAVRSVTSGPGDGGNIQISAAVLTINSGGLQAGTVSAEKGIGRGGDIDINVGKLELFGSGAIDTTSFGLGDAGNISIKAKHSMTISAEAGEFLAVSSDTTGPGNAGRIIISAPILLVDGGQISTDTLGSGRGGDIQIDVGKLILTRGGFISSSNSFSDIGDGGTISIRAKDSIMISGKDIFDNASGIFSEAGIGNGGDIELQGKNIRLSNGAIVTAESSFSTGNAGDITITATDSFQSINSSVTTQAVSSDGGNITIHVGSLVDLFNSKVTASVEGGAGKGGNIIIDPPLVVLNHSQISADAHGGPGGNITIVASAFLKSADSTVTASSDLSTQGTVNIQSPVTNISGAIAPLPEAVLQATSLLRQSCATRLSDRKLSSLVFSGRHGLPMEPGNLMPSPPHRVESPSTASSQRGIEPYAANLIASVNPLLLSNSGCTK